MSARTRERKCPSCGCTRISRDPQSNTGDLVCENCGTVQEENPIVSEVQFGESSSGAAVVQGSMVGPNQTRAFSQGSALESKEHTLLRARYKMKIIAQVMRIPEYIVTSAFGWFTLALNKNFVKGRRSQNVLAACLYVACRKVKTHHLLIDFSSRLQISVYSLGATFLKLVRLLEIKKLEPVDTSLFIQHFAEKLGFGDQISKVCKDATALARRMSADWICHGRRPAGIAGACLLLAARMNNFQRSHAELVAVAHVAEETIQRRLNEFKKTSSANISIQGFRTATSNPQYFDSTDAKPPAINRNKEIERKVQKVLRQRTRTLERYRDLAKSKKLLNTLDVLPELKLRRDAAENTDETNNATESVAPASTNESEDESEILKSVEAINPCTLAQSGLGLSDSETRPRMTRSRAKKLNNEDGETESDQVKQEIEDENDSSSDNETNELFVPRDDLDDDHFGFDDLPDAPLKDDGDDDDDYSDPEPRFVRKAPKKALSRSSGRLEGLSSLRGSSSRKSRLGGLSSSQRLNTKSKNKDVENEDSADNGVEREARQDELLKAILDGGNLKEEDLERALDAILQKNKPNSANDETSYDYKNDDERQRIIQLHWPRNLVKNCPTSDDILKKVRDDEELDEIDDDDEVNAVKLTEEEVKEKERMWIAINHDFLIAQEKKRLKLVADELTGNNTGQFKRRRTTVSRTPLTSEGSRFNSGGNRTMSPAESTRQMLQKKAYSKKINYDIFPNLFAEQTESLNSYI